MMVRQWLLISLCLFVLVSFHASAEDIIVSYNVENFFDARHDSLKHDEDFLPEGKYRWTFSRQERKAEQIARVIAGIGGWNTPLVVGLCEVENAYCIERLCHHLPGYPYRYLHYESDDRRGVDVALLYDSTCVSVQESKPLKVNLGDEATRDILYAKLFVHHTDTIHVFMCHLPSMIGGRSVSAWKRLRAKEVISIQTDSILACNKEAAIVVMGDMNDHPQNDIRDLYNKMIELEKNGKGTEKYKGYWSCLDQFYLSEVLDTVATAYIYDAEWLMEDEKRRLGMIPKRTFTGYRYHSDGYSDHLPIVLRLTLKSSR